MSRQRHTNLHNGPLPLATANRHAEMMQIQDALHQRQPQAAASDPFGIPPPIQFFIHLINFVFGNTDSIVGDFKIDHIPVIGQPDFDVVGGLGPFLARHLDAGPVRDAVAGRARPCDTYRRYDWSLQHEPAE